MSWEIVREDKMPCGCGLGFILTVGRSDDWNRTEEDISLQCSECAKNFVRYSYNYHNSGMLETATYWVKKVDYETFCQLKSELEAINAQGNKEVTDYLRLHYLKPWLDLFIDVPRNKKAVWNKLKLLGLTHYSYSTFSGKFKTGELEGYIESFVGYIHIKKITKILSINDKHIETIPKSTQAVQDQYDEARRVMMKNALR